MYMTVKMTKLHMASGDECYRVLVLHLCQMQNSQLNQMNMTVKITKLHMASGDDATEY